MKILLINCLIFLILFQNYNLKLVNISSDFQLDFTSTSGWNGGSNSQKHTCQFGNIFGPFGKDNKDIYRTFSNLPPHYSLSMSIIYYSLWSWDTEFMGVYIDNTLYYGRNIHLHNDLYNDSNCVGGYTMSQGIPLAFNITHTSSSATIKFHNGLNEPANNEGMGLSRFYLNVDECHFTCLTCNGPNENQCLTCPSNSVKTGQTCKCNSGTYSSNHQCQAICPSGHSKDTVTRRCNDNCPIQNCSVCTDQLCTSCNSGFKLSKGQCFNRCPWYTTENNGICVDTDYNNIPRPYVVAENMVNTDFNHGELQSQGWSYKKFQVKDGIQFSNLVAGSCQGLSLAAGFNFMPFLSDTCSSGCGLLNNYTNLPPHYKVTVKYLILCGDTWDNEPYYLVIDGVERQRDNFQWTKAASFNFVCGNNNSGWAVHNNLQQQYKSKTIDHTSSSLSIELGYAVNENQYNEWAGYREVLIVLHQCDNANCSACTISGMNCTACVGSTGQVSSRVLNNQCQCPSGFYDIGAVECCPAIGCSSCSNTTSCDTCLGSIGQNSSRILNSKCICPDKYFDDQPNNEECQECSYLCLTCTSNKDNCTSCIAGPNRNAKPDCSCMDGYYEDSNKDCQKCDYNCSKCTGSRDNCTECKGSNRSSSFPQCLCNLGYFDDGINSNCVECQHPCVNCKSLTVCDSCVLDINRLDKPTCSCKIGYFENDSNVCQKCHHKCNSCVDQYDNCTQCKGSDRNSSFPSCQCNPGFFDDGTNSNCATCVHPCVNCTQLNQCTSCVAGDNRLSAPSTCNCINHYYENSSKQCVICDYKCNDCIGTSDNCTSCQGSNRSTTYPGCLCNNQYFDNGTDKNCVACVHPCVNCKSLTQCDTCVSGSNRNPSPYCTCTDGYYETLGKQCEKCDNNCQLCQGQSDNCTQCAGQNRLSAFPDCLCVKGYYDDNTNADCVECTTGCSACDYQNTCTECSDGYYLNNNNCIKCPNKFSKCSDAETGTECASGIGRTGQIPDCGCSATFFDNNTNSNDCNECQHPCINCETTALTCTSCHVADNRKGISDCNCINGYFEETDLTCQICTSPCKECEITTKKCTECINTLNREITPSCLCTPGYFENESLVCEICIHPCKRCTGTNQTCDECVPGSNRIQDAKCECEPGYYDDGTICQPCDLTKCSTCVNTPTECILCADITRGGEDCTCLVGFFEEGVAACGTCDYYCKSCKISSSQCTECSDDNRDFSNDCKCIDKYYDDGSNPDCIECVFPCVNCLSFNVCTSCSGDHRQLPSCSCIQGYFNNDQSLCQECDIQCKSCLNSQDNCLLCKSGLHRTLQFPQCGCRDGYYEQENVLDCIQCFLGCRICEKYTGKCLECDVPTFSTLNCQEESQGKFLETITDSNNLSLELQVNGQCQNQCFTCENSANNCTSCKIGQNRLNNAPHCECKQGYHDNMSLTDDCFVCPKTCKTCKSQNYCLTCNEEQNRVLNKINMKCECLNNFKEDKSQPDICIPCFQYKGQCFVDCPLNTISDNLNKICVEKIITQSNSNLQIMVICVVSIIIVQVIIGLLIKIFTTKKLTKLYSKPKQIDISGEKSDNVYESKEKSSFQNESINL